ncbi:MAG: hypothetical protein ACPGOV_08095 [Magnetovibrionaceae bacterium]
MFNWLRQRKRNSFVAAAREEMQTFTANLELLDGPGRATVVVVATQLRVNLEREEMVPAGLFGLDSNPGADPYGKFMDKLDRLVRGFLKRDNASDTAAAYVWLHTVRALYYPELREEGRALWTALSEGFDHLLPAFAAAEEQRGHPLEPGVVEGARFIPQGLERGGISS